MPASPPQPFPAAAPAAPGLEAARQRVVRVLTDRYADDTLDVETFEAYLDRMHALTDVDALDAMARSLEPQGAWPHVHRPSQQPTAAVAPVRAPAVPDADAVHSVFAFMGSTKRRGVWAVDRQVSVSAVLGEVVLDLRDAVLPPVCDAVVFAFMGNVKIIVPPGVDVRMDMDAILGSAEDRTHGAGAAWGPGTRLRVAGTVMLAEVVVVARERGDGRR